MRDLDGLAAGSWKPHLREAGNVDAVVEQSVLGMKNMIVTRTCKQRLVGIDSVTQLVKSSIGSAGWMNIMVGNEDEGLGRFRFFERLGK